MEDQYLEQFLTNDWLRKLLAKHFATGLNEKEQILFDQWVSEKDNAAWWNEINNKEELIKDLKRLSEIKNNRESYYKKLDVKIKFLSHHNLTWWQLNRSHLLVAATIVGLIAMILWFWLRLDNDKQRNTVMQGGLIADAKPGKFKARLTLSNGSTIALDSSTAIGQLAEEGKMLVLNDNGKLVYKGNTKQANKNIYNVLTTDKAQVYSTILSDGTKAWLNSATSLRYPVAFDDDIRKVELVGEAYFEVEPASKPFIIATNDMEIEVLGTEFNVNAYADEPVKRTTLLIGKVKVQSTRTGQLTILSPGQQVAIYDRSFEKIDNANTDQAIAWKNGYFQFSNDDLQTVMRQLSRWYNLEVVYAGETPKIMFRGKLPRNAKASVVLRVLEKNNVHFKIEGNKIIVSP
jgi:transmembrane sensor